MQQEQGSWHGRACSCCPEVLLKTVQDCWSQHNDGSDIQQHGLLTEGQSPLVHQRSNDQVSNSDESADVPVLQRLVCAARAGSDIGLTCET